MYTNGYSPRGLLGALKEIREESRPSTFNFYEKLHCKGEPYWFSGWWDPLVHTDRHNLLLSYSDVINNYDRIFLFHLKPSGQLIDFYSLIWRLLKGDIYVLKLDS